jgi:hypothetical protein
MKVKFMKEVELENDFFSIETLCEIIKWQFNDVIRTQNWRIIKIWRNKYINIDYNSDKKFLSCYIELWNTYMRYDRTLEGLLYVVKNDPYIKRNFKY